MANPVLANIYDPETLMALVGEEWLNAPKLVMSPAVRRDARPTQGTLFSDVRQNRFQGQSGEALLACGTITEQNKTQVLTNAPVIWRYMSTKESPTLEQIEVTRINDMRISMASEIREASVQFVDDSIRATIEGVGASLTGNQEDYSATGTIDLTALKNAKALSLDKIDSLNSGAIVMHSKVYYDALALGLVAATSNTMGNAFQNQMVASGQLPENILGLTPIVTDKLTVTSGAPDTYHTFLVGRDALVLRGDSTPTVDTQEDINAFCTTIKFMVSFGVGVPGVNWTVAGKENVTDTELATNTSWALSTNTNSNDVPIYRLDTQ